jgi:hypothetical protein
MIDPGDRENESEDQDDPADGSGEQEHLLDAVVRSKPLSHGRNSPAGCVVWLYRLWGL